MKYSKRKVASVTRKGVIKAKKTGNCKIYISLQNGITRTIRVTVN